MKKEHNQQFNVQSVTMTFILFKCHRPIDNSTNFYLILLWNKDTKVFSGENSKPCCESWITTH